MTRSPEPNPESPHQGDLLLRGDYYLSASGPAIILFLASTAAARWLDALFRDLYGSLAPVDLARDPRVRITNLQSLSLVQRTQGEAIELRLTGNDVPPRFTLFVTGPGIDYIRGLIEPFLNGETGHQYLTTGGVDDALVELSFGERIQADW